MIVYTKDINQSALGKYGLMGFRLEDFDDEVKILFFKERFIRMISKHIPIKDLLTICANYVRGMNGR